MADDEREVWRARFIDYYRQNAPDKVRLVTDKMLDKFAGRYDELMDNIIAKYGPPGQPHARAPAPAPRSGAPGGGFGGYGGAAASGGSSAGAKVADWSHEFVELIAAAMPHESAAPRDAYVVDAKSTNATNGLETSTFTVCTRIRPPLGDEVAGGGENFVCVVPGQRRGAGFDHSEDALLLTPSVSLQGQPKLTKKNSTFDYVFGPCDTNEDVFQALGIPLVQRAMEGMVGVVFAYGQTGSGKTHTMNGLMDGIVPCLFGEDRTVRFSYFEALGTNISDCLVRTQAPKGVQIGEGMDGRVITRGLSEHEVQSAAELSSLVEVAKSRRTTAATEKNDASSRSHGIAVISIGQPGSAYEEVRVGTYLQGCCRLASAFFPRSLPSSLIPSLPAFLRLLPWSRR